MPHPHVIVYVGYTSAQGHMHGISGVALIGPSFPPIPDNVVAWTFLAGPPDRISHPRWMTGQPVQIRVPRNLPGHANTLYDIDEVIEEQDDALYRQLVAEEEV